MRHLITPVVLAALLKFGAIAQERPKPLDPKKAHASYSFPVRGGAEPFRFQVELDKTSTVTGVSVFRQGELSPFQTLPACDKNL